MSALTTSDHYLQTAISQNPVIVAVSATVAYAIDLMNERDSDSILVLDNNQLVGIITTHDLAQQSAAGKNLTDLSITELMSSPVVFNPAAIYHLVETLAQKVASLESAQLDSIKTHSGQSKDKFLTTVSHELRTPLNAILGMSESLLAEVYGLLNERQRKSIATIHSSGNHLLALLSNLLQISNIAESPRTNKIPTMKLPLALDPKARDTPDNNNT
jgi:signal transduction histidine kinase